MRKRKRGLTQRQLMTYLATHAPCGYQCFTTQIASDGRWRAECIAIIEGWPVTRIGLDATYPTRNQALAAAYNAARERERRIWTSESVRPASKN